MKLIAGVDEVGRGSLIGPVYAAAVILNKSINKKLLNRNSLTASVSCVQCVNIQLAKRCSPAGAVAWTD